jgi:hypothetical protein
VGGDPERAGILPIQELETALTQAKDTVGPEHLGFVQEIAARTLFHQKFSSPPQDEKPPQDEEKAREVVDIAVQYKDLGRRADELFKSRPTLPARWWLVRRHHVIQTRAFIWCRPWPELRRKMGYWTKWKALWDSEKLSTESATVDQPVRDYWLAVWMSQRGHVELQGLDTELMIEALTPDRTEVQKRLKEAISLEMNGIFYRRRAIRRGTGQADDGYETLTQGLADQAVAYWMLITSCWQVLERLGEDPAGLVRLTVDWERAARLSWERARVACRERELLPKSYARFATTAAYAAAIRKCRDNPDCQLHELEAAARDAFHQWLSTYPYEAARDPAYEGQARDDKLRMVCERIANVEPLVRQEARDWIGHE